MKPRAVASAALERVPGAGVVRRVLEHSDLPALARDEAAVDSLEVAVAENTRLAALLETQVAALEDQLMELVESLEGDTP